MKNLADEVIQVVYNPCVCSQRETRKKILQGIDNGEGFVNDLILFFLRQIRKDVEAQRERQRLCTNSEH